jgi:hypothetical protein
MKYNDFLNRVSAGEDKGDYPYGHGWGKCYIHRMDDSDALILSYEGMHLATIHPSEAIELNMPRQFNQYSPTGYLNQIKQLLSNEYAEVYGFIKKTRVNGALFQLEWSHLVRNPPGRYPSYRRDGDPRFAEFHKRVIITRDPQTHEMLVDTSKDLVFNVDQEAKKKFYAHLRELKKQLAVRIRMGAMNTKYRTELAGALTNSPYIDDETLRHECYRTVKAWIIDRDVNRITYLLKLAIALSEYSYSYKQHDTEGKMLYALDKLNKWLRSEHSMQECVTIQSPTTEQHSGDEDGTDQNMVIQPADGLRDVQVPCEAEVCGPDSGTTASAPSGEDRTPQ